MQIKRVRGRRNPPEYRVEGGERKFVALAEVARRVHLRDLRQLWWSFSEANTTTYRNYVPWVFAANAQSREVEVPAWGTEPSDEHFEQCIYVDAAWAWDAIHLYRIHHDYENSAPPQVMIEKLNALVAYYRALVPTLQIKAHRDTRKNGPTKCPGSWYNGWVKQFK